MERLYQIDEEVRRRGAQVTAERPDWPCRRGCDDCCRHLASVPRVSRVEWARVAEALWALPGAVTERIRASVADERPVVCPLLDRESGVCLVYEARPVACRAYGFYAERQYVLGCHRIEAMAAEAPEVVWGNHPALERDLAALGETAELFRWLAREDANVSTKPTDAAG